MDNENLKIILKDYEFKKLNQEVKKNLKSIGDYIKYINNEKFNYVILCGISFDKKILDQINFNKKINNIGTNIEEKFINEYSKKFNLQFLNE